jgi:hypothetical protein
MEERHNLNFPTYAAAEAVALFCYQAKKWIGSYAEIGHSQIAQQSAAVGVGIGAHPPVILGASSANSGMSRPLSSNSSSAL